MNKKSTLVGSRNDWKKALNKDFETSERKFQTTARFSKPVFSELEARAKQNNSSIAEEIRKAVRKGLKGGSE